MKEENCDSHKLKGICKIEGCENQRKLKARCPQCGIERYGSTCRSHHGDGSKKLRTRGKKTTKHVRELQKQARLTPPKQN